MKLNKRVFGITGIEAKMTCWNADFNNMPRTLADGTIFGSQQTLKYQIRKRISELYPDLSVFTKKTYKENSDGSLIPRTLEERFMDLFNLDSLSELTVRHAQEMLLNCIDIKCFGLVFSIKKLNFGITGVVSFADGMNCFDQTSTEEITISSSWRNPKTRSVKNENDEYEEVEASATTLGTKYITDEAHYIYPFIISPNVLDMYVQSDICDAFSEEDYKCFVHALLSAGQASPSSRKAGCSTEFVILVEAKDQTLSIPPLDNIVSIKHQNKFEKKKLIIDFNSLSTLKDRIDNIKIYYNVMDTELEIHNDTDIKELIHCLNILEYC